MNVTQRNMSKVVMSVMTPMIPCKSSNYSLPFIISIAAEITYHARVSVQFNISVVLFARNLNTCNFGIWAASYHPLIQGALQLASDSQAKGSELAFKGLASPSGAIWGPGFCPRSLQHADRRNRGTNPHPFDKQKTATAI